MKHFKYLYYKIPLIFLATLSLSSCKDFLEVKPDQRQQTISSLKDLQDLLNDFNLMNNYGAALAVTGSDEYYITSSVFENAPVDSRNAYIWKEDFFSSEWGWVYQKIQTANTVLQEVDRIKKGSEQEKKYIRGQALFFRAFAFYHLAQLYCKPYSANAPNDLGLPLRLTANLEEKINRATVQETYEQIIRDVNAAELLLPLKNNTINLPSKLACYGFLARVYLSMSDYIKSMQNADKYLEIAPKLLKYYELDASADPSMSTTNIESSFLAFVENSVLIGVNTIFVNQNLISSYADNDLRKDVLFRFNPDGSAVFKGSYYSYFGAYGESPYYGIATDEIYLTRAECRIRNGNISDGMADLNTLLESRWKLGTFSSLTADTKDEAIAIIIQERKKELIFRGTRWTDLRRLNLEGANIDLKREINGITYTLTANDKRWVWLIPHEVITLSGIQQNAR